MADYISVVCPHCGKEAARLRAGLPSAPKSQPAPAEMSPEEQAKLKLIDELGFSVRTWNCLLKIEPEIRTLGDLIKLTKAELLRQKNFGPRCLNEVVERLANLNLSLARFERPRRWNEQTKTYEIIETLDQGTAGMM